MKYNYFNFKRFGDKFLLTNDLGKYCFVYPNEMEKLIGKRVGPDDKCCEQLREKAFIYDEPEEVFAARVEGEIRGNKSYLFYGPSLHIFVLTDECNMECIYCQARSKSQKKHGKMSEETARRAVDIALCSPERYLTFEFQGGEPLLNFDVLKFIVLYTEQHKGDKCIRYTVASNLTLLNDDILSFFSEHKVAVSVSLDGNKNVHDHNRINKCHTDMFDTVCRNISLAREADLDVSAVETTTRYGLSYWREMVDTYISLGLKNIFIRPLTPLGTAYAEWNEIGYTPEAFLEFYRSALEYILEKNRNGYCLSEGHATIFLRKILNGYSYNYMELRSPCGAALGQIAYYYDGEIYTCDEGRMLSEMGNKAFKLGSVNTSTYNELIDSPVCKTACSASVLECAPTCESCAYQPYCGICPVVNYALYGDVVSKIPGNYRCRIYGGILDTLFSLIKDDENSIKAIFENWI